MIVQEHFIAYCGKAVKLFRFLLSLHSLIQTWKKKCAELHFSLASREEACFFVNLYIILEACGITEFENPWLNYLILSFLLNAIYKHFGLVRIAMERHIYIQDSFVWSIFLPALLSWSLHSRFRIPSFHTLFSPQTFCS